MEKVKREERDEARLELVNGGERWCETRCEGCGIGWEGWLTWKSARSAGEKDWLLASKTPTVDRAEPLPVMPYTDDNQKTIVHRTEQIRSIKQ